MLPSLKHLLAQLEQLETSAGKTKAQVQATNHQDQSDAQVSVSTARAMHFVLRSQMHDTLQLHLDCVLSIKRITLHLVQIALL